MAFSLSSDNRQKVHSLVSEFLAYMENVRRLASLSAKCYFIDINQYFDFFSQNEERVISAGTELITEFLTSIKKNHNYSSNTIARKLAVISSFYKWLQITGIVHVNPAKAIKWQRKVENLPVIVKDDDFNALVSGVDSRWDILTLRDLAIAHLFRSTGIRVRDLARLNHSDFDEVNGKLRVKVDLVTEKNILLDEKTSKALNEYVAALRLHQISPAALFINVCGGRISTRSIRRRISLHARKADLGEKINPRSLRHTFLSSANLELRRAS